MCCAIIAVFGQGLLGCAGGDDGLQYWWDRLAAVTGRYSRVLMLGDSMGATAALLFSPLATAVHAFTPQVRHAMMVLSLGALGTNHSLHEGDLCKTPSHNSFESGRCPALLASIQGTKARSAPNTHLLCNPGN